VTIKFAEPGLEALKDRAAEQFGGNLSGMLREFISYALVNYPRTPAKL
jgi:hypothetical protein